MKKTIKAFICVMLAMVLMLSMTACGGKDEPKNPTPSNTEQNQSNLTENPNNTNTEPADEPDPTPAVDKQAFYETLFATPENIQLNARNIVVKIGSEAVTAESIVGADGGDVMIKMVFGDAGYAMYKVGEEAYMTINIPAMEDGEGGMTEAQNLYYKITGSEEYTPTEDAANMNLDDVQDMLSDNSNPIVSITYVGQKDFHGTLCDEVTVVMRQEVNNSEIIDFDDRVEADLNDTEDKSEGDDEVDGDILTVGATDGEVQYEEVAYSYYFNAETNAFFGVYGEKDGSIVEIYLPETVTVTVPEGNYEEADDETIASAMFTIMILMLSASMGAE